MPNQGFGDDVFHDLIESASVFGRLAKDDKAFGEAYEAFLTGDVFGGEVREGAEAFSF